MVWTLGRGVPPFLGEDFPLPLDRPFTTVQAHAAGISRSVLARLIRESLVRRLLRSVYVAAQVPDTLGLRTQALQLIVPEDAVVTDWTACWLLTGALPPNQHVEIPPVSMFRLPGRGRLRNRLCHSGERGFAREDLMMVGGMRVTTPLRTALDLGRLTHRDLAIVALDALLATETFTRARLIADVERFRGYRGVVQLRELAPLADPRAESGPESVLRLRWNDLSHLPQPVPQVPVLSASGRELYRIDLGIEDLLFGVEYDGEEYHSSEQDRARDRARRRDLEENFGWLIRPVTKHNVFGVTRDVERIIIEGIRQARRRRGLAA